MAGPAGTRFNCLNASALPNVPAIKWAPRPPARPAARPLSPSLQRFQTSKSVCRPRRQDASLDAVSSSISPSCQSVSIKAAARCWSVIFCFFDRKWKGTSKTTYHEPTWLKLWVLTMYSGALKHSMEPFFFQGKVY